jgi:hypothetical protein
MIDNFDLKGFLYNNPLLEKKKLKKKKSKDETPELDTPDTDIEMDMPDTNTPEPKMNLDTTSNSNFGDDNLNKIEKLLLDAHEAAKQLGDEKLIDQIGNTLTFFSRTYIAQTAKPSGPKSVSN